MRGRVRITVQGQLSPRLAAAFEGLTPVQHGDCTDLVGEIGDQAQLFGHLTRVRDLGLELVSFLPEPNNRSEHENRT